MAKPPKPLAIDTLTHTDASRRNIPTAEFESVMREEDKTPVQLAYARRNADLDPQLVWRGKDVTDWSDLIVQAPPLYIQEKVHPKVLIDDLKRQSKARARETAEAPADLFADFNGLADKEAATEFYQHDQHWSNRMISGDSLSVMASLAEREGLRAKVQCIYFDPPYGIKFNSNFQWSTTSRDVKDGAKDHVTREPEQVRAFRDTWRDGIHSYLTYLRDRLTVARDLLAESGSIFVQIGDENVHRVRAVMDEVFGDENFVNQIAFKTTTGRAGDFISSSSNYLLWYGRSIDATKYRIMFQDKSFGTSTDQVYSLIRFGNLITKRISQDQRSGKADIPDDARLFRPDNLTSQTGGASTNFSFQGAGKNIKALSRGGWKTNQNGMTRLIKSDRIWITQNETAQYIRYYDDFAVMPFSNVWTDTGTGSFTDDKIYVVQSATKVIERCILMTTDPGDLVLDPTCGSGTTATVAEQWGRRWITIDTSRVAIALARSRMMGARYPYYLLADSPAGQRKEGEVTRTAPRITPTHGDIRQGFVYERVPHITLKSIANNAEIDVIWDKWEARLAPLRAALTQALAPPPTSLRGGEADEASQGAREATGLLRSARNDAGLKPFEEWEIPREKPANWPAETEPLFEAFWQARIARQKEIDASIAARAEYEYLYDKPYSDKDRVRVAGPFTVESLSPHRTLTVDWDDELVDMLEDAPAKAANPKSPDTDFAQMILESLKTAGVQQAHKDGRINFSSLKGWPGRYICAEGLYNGQLSGESGEGSQATTLRAGIFIGPEFGTVSRPDLVAAAREAGDAGFDVLVACAFNYDAHSAEFDKLGRVQVLKARMNPDLHMGGDLKPSGYGNLFVIFGEPDVKVEDAGADADGNPMIRVKVFGVDVFKPQTGEVISEGTDGIALWMLDTDYNEESFFVRHAYFLGANDPYKALKATLKAEIDEDAWASLYSDVSRPFAKPKSGRIAVKVINHLGDEVMKIFGVE
ncbi:MAG: site-specific DNA-methyltransferase [Hyphomicrobiales bacterium]|nr:site-specific DNA-methyltransferase [Hyphomicrobiales bacterium]MDE2114762.1 site-specific DNA-methyltransferase [Hyphomicrobiales bacterium]